MGDHLSVRKASDENNEPRPPRQVDMFHIFVRFLLEGNNVRIDIVGFP